MEKYIFFNQLILGNNRLFCFIIKKKHEQVKFWYSDKEGFSLFWKTFEAWAEDWGTFFPASFFSQDKIISELRIVLSFLKILKKVKVIQLR